MKAKAPTVLSGSVREARFFDFILASILLALFVFNVFTIKPTLSPLTLLFYTLLTLVTIAMNFLESHLWAGSTPPFRSPVAWWHIMISETIWLIILLAFVLVLRGQAELYFYMFAIGAYVWPYLLTGTHYWSIIYFIAVILVAGLNYVVLWGVPAGARALMGDLVWYGLFFIISEFFVRQWRQREKMEKLSEELARANRQLRDFTVQAEALAVAQERTRLGHEIHDTVGHTLTGIDLQLELLTRLPPDRSAQRRQALEQARALAKSGLVDVRRAVKALRPAALETFSLPEAIGTLVDSFQEARPIRTRWQVEGKISPLPPHLAILLYRGAQEALTNVQRHAPEAREVSLKLHYGPDEIGLTVKNDGIASSGSLDAGIAFGGNGLNGLRERAKTLGGSFRTGPDGNGLFWVEIRLPHS